MTSDEREREYLLDFIDNSNEVKRWHADPDSTEDAPVIFVEVYEEIEVNFVAFDD